jgi:hypothetical protein
MRNPIYNGINDTITDEAYRDAVRQERAEMEVLKVRGSYDAPGFDACVKAEIASKDTLLLLDAAMELLIELRSKTGSSEIADALDMLSAWREQYVQDNSQHGMGA